MTGGGGRYRPGGMTQQQGCILRTHKVEARKLPEHGDTWTNQEVGLDRATLRRFSKIGIIHKRGKADVVDNRSYWETADGVHEWLAARDHGTGVTPCENATGIRTIEPGTYTCTDESCDCRMDRETAEAVVP